MSRQDVTTIGGYTRPPYARVRAAILRSARLILVGMTIAAPPAAADVESPEAGTDERPPRPLRAVAGILGVNALVWSFDRYVREGGENPEFRISFDSVWENVKNGFEWDNNDFGTNNFSHPYHGSMYYTAARANGFDYWESIPLVFGGSLLWEYTGEINNPAYNDWVNTCVGGIALGEALYRLSDLVLDDTATGAGRTWREIGGLLISPMRGINRLIDGDWSRVGPNAPDRRPDHLALQIDVGARMQSRRNFGTEDTTSTFVLLDLHYGDPFLDDDRRVQPFSSFAFSTQVNLGDKAALGRIESHAWLYGTRRTTSDGHRHVLGAFQYFDYIDNRAYEFGGHTVGARLLSRFGSETHGTLLETNLAAGVLVLAGTSSSVANFTGRDYDYGSGASLQAGFRVARAGRTIVLASIHASWLYTLNGVPGDYYVSVSRLQGFLPLPGRLGAGGELRYYHREAWYDDFGTQSRRFPEARLFLGVDF